MTITFINFLEGGPENYIKFKVKINSSIKIIATNLYMWKSQRPGRLGKVNSQNDFHPVSPKRDNVANDVCFNFVFQPKKNLLISLTIQLMLTSLISYPCGWLFNFSFFYMT